MVFAWVWESFLTKLRSCFIHLDCPFLLNRNAEPLGRLKEMHMLFCQKFSYAFVKPEPNLEVQQHHVYLIWIFIHRLQSMFCHCPLNKKEINSIGTQLSCNLNFSFLCVIACDIRIYLQNKWITLFLQNITSTCTWKKEKKKDWDWMNKQEIIAVFFLTYYKWSVLGFYRSDAEHKGDEVLGFILGEVGLFLALKVCWGLLN